MLAQCAGSRGRCARAGAALGRGSAVEDRGDPPGFLQTLNLKRMRPTYFVMQHIPRHLRGRFFCVLALRLLIPKSLRPELLRFGARLIERVESTEARANWKSEFRNGKSGIRRRDCGRGLPGVAWWSAAYIRHVTTVVTQRQSVSL